MGAAESLFPEQNEADEGEALASPTVWLSALSRVEVSEEALLRVHVPESFEFEFEERLQEAKQLLTDPRVSAVRYSLVPSVFNEAHFWRRLFFTLTIASAEMGTPSKRPASYEDRVDEYASDGSPSDVPYSTGSIGMGADFTPRGTAIGAYDDFTGCTPPRR
ncbi:hypothetical protein AB1Y20_009697 [Prymnesium parvum]|uniref:BSD domain-containing protein n=1 Tax=Prymnesium parvum TaxID=97485 RepID=A0AB34K509_PRYPA